ncbi:MAG: hypothetical protein EOO38_21745 [Cytophagaceae bacterium]|nr:MAG: hypothetical protein EOO38_21745 [Cytophagaceae bacterium]
MHLTYFFKLLTPTVALFAVLSTPAQIPAAAIFARNMTAAPDEAPKVITPLEQAVGELDTAFRMHVCTEKLVHTDTEKTIVLSTGWKAGVRDGNVLVLNSYQDMVGKSLQGEVVSESLSRQEYALPVARFTPETVSSEASEFDDTKQLVFLIAPGRKTLIHNKYTFYVNPETANAKSHGHEQDIEMCQLTLDKTQAPEEIVRLLKAVFALGHAN